MPFLGQELSPEIASNILAFCSPIPHHRYNGLPAASQDCHAHWRNMLLRRAREIYMSFRTFRAGLNLPLPGGRLVHRRLTRLEGVATYALDGLAGLLGLI